MKIEKNSQNSDDPISRIQISFDFFIYLFFLSKDQAICFPVWLTNDTQFLYQDVSIFDFFFLSTYFFM